MSGALRVAAAGIGTTVQDLGRHGYQRLGVPVSGALDAVSLKLANGLVGNPPNCAGLEILFRGPTLEVAADSVRVALAGSGVGIEILGPDGHRIPAWRSVRLRRGQSFRIGAFADSACCYLAVEGGFAIAPVLGSLSTYARGALGGWQGRALRPGDALPLALGDAVRRDEAALPRPPDFAPDRPIRVVLGPQQDHFAEEALPMLLGTEYRVSHDADRMGMRLDGAALRHEDGYNIISDGIATGAIQVPGSGRPIVLLADHQTTGGYPKIATVISADLPLIGRRKPGDAVRFAAVAVAEAERLRRAQERMIADLLAAAKCLEDAARLDLASLYGGNLISGVVSGLE